jgi:hypothetical protein
MQKSKGVFDSILAIMMNMYYPHCPFPSRKWRVAYQRLWEPQRVSLTTLLPSEIIFTIAFPLTSVLLKFSLLP